MKKDIFLGVLIGQASFLVMGYLFLEERRESYRQNQVIASQGLGYILLCKNSQWEEAEKDEKVAKWIEYYSVYDCKSRGVGTVFFQAINQRPEVEKILNQRIPGWVDEVKRKYKGADTLIL